MSRTGTARQTRKPNRTLRDFAGLEDADAMRAVLARHLRWMDGGAVEVLSCAVTYARTVFRRFLIHYDVRVRDPRTGGERAELVTGIASGREKARKLHKRGDPPPYPAGPHDLAPLAVVPELNLVLHVFPADQRLHALAQLVRDPASLLAPHVLPEGERAAWHWTVETVRYRTGMRATLRIAVEDAGGSRADTGTRRIYAKVFADDADGEQAFRVQQALWDQTTAEDAPFAVARPIAYLAEARTLLLGEVRGVSLRDILLAGKPNDAEIRRAARAIAAFHHIPAETVLANPRRRQVRDEANRLEKIGARLRANQPQLGGRLDQVLAAIADRLTSDPAALTHFDLRPDHLLFAEGGLGLLDFDKLAIADPMVDVANMLAILGKDWGSGKSSGSGPEHLPRLFAEEYFAHVPASWRDRLPAHYALALLALAASDPADAEPDEGSGRPLPPDELIRQAEEILAG